MNITPVRFNSNKQSNYAVKQQPSFGIKIKFNQVAGEAAKCLVDCEKASVKNDRLLTLSGFVEAVVAHNGNSKKHVTNKGEVTVQQEMKLDNDGFSFNIYDDVTHAQRQYTLPLGEDARKFLNTIHRELCTGRKTHELATRAKAAIDTVTRNDGLKVD